MSQQELEKKTAKAKMYNLKSAIEGSITMMETDIMTPRQAVEGASTLAGKMVMEFDKQCGAVPS